jgi:hypothetical protein
LIFRGDQYGYNDTYPRGGLAWDIRQPYEAGYKVWMAEIVTTDEGYGYGACYRFDPFGIGLPEGWICRLDMDGEITPENYLDLSLYEIDLNHNDWCDYDLVQTGGSQMWYIIAGVPEPALGQLGGLMLGIAGIGLAATRRRGGRREA